MRSSVVLASIIIHHSLAVKPFQEPMLSFATIFLVVLAIMDFMDFAKKHKLNKK